ncbi:MAG TPA: phage portal protein [Clostridiales bacterium]|nr:phage portal protein [Clostridiales bacterium]
MNTDIDFNNLDQIRQVIQNYIFNDDCAYKKFAEQAQRGFDYYDNHDDVKRFGAAAIDEVNKFLKLKGSNPLRSADNRISMNRHRVAVDQKIGYLFSVPPQFDIPSDDTDKGDEKLLQRVNDAIGTQWAKVIRQLGIDASNTGRAWLTYWADNDTKRFDYWYLNPMTVAPIYDRSTVKKRLKYLLRVYAFNDANGRPVTRYELWSDKQVAYLIRPEAVGTSQKPAIAYDTLPDGSWNIQPHNYGRIPFIEFRNNAKGLPDLIMYKDIIDALDKLMSGFANDIDDLQEIIWVIKNYNGQRSAPVYDKDGNQLKDEDGNPITRPVDPIQLMKAKKWIGVDDQGGVDAVRGEIPYEARSKFREILNDEFWTAAMAVNPNPPTAGNQSGVYIDYLYGLLELKSGLMETEFRDSIDEFLRAVLHYLGADENKQFVQTWKRTKPQNATEISQIIAQTPDTVMSDETKTKVHPLVTDWQAERAQVENEQTEKQKNMLDSFGQPHTEPDGNGQKLGPPGQKTGAQNEQQPQDKGEPQK